MKIYIYCTLCDKKWNVSIRSEVKNYICPYCVRKKRKQKKANQRELNMREGVTKEEFIEKYSELLKMTREEIEKLELKNDETAIIKYKGGYKTEVNIACNSGIATIRDIARQI